MNRKHYIILMVTFIFVIIACVFLSQTIQSITAPKAEFIKPYERTINTQYQLDGYFAMPDTKECYLTEDQRGPVTITRLLATPGLEVKKGQLLFETEVSDVVLAQRDALETALNRLLQDKATLYETLMRENVDLDSRPVKLMNEYIELNKSILFLAADTQEYRDAQRRLAALEAEMDQAFAPGSQYQLVFDWYNLQNEIDAMVEEMKEHPSQQEMLGMQLDVLLERKLSLYQDMLAEDVDLASGTVQKLFDYLTLERSVLMLNQANPEYPALRERLTAMGEEINDLLATDQSEQYDIVFRWYDLLCDIDKAATNIDEFDAMVDAMKSCVAPCDGIVTEVYGKIGMVYTGDQPLYAISATGEMGVAADISRSSPSEYVLTNLFQCAYRGDCYTCDYVSVVEDKNTGEKTLYIKPKGELSIDPNNPASALNEAVTVYTYSRPVNCEFALPLSAIFEEGGEEYVYVARLEKDFWGEHYKAQKTQVTVNITGGGYAGIDSLYLNYDEYVLNYWNKNVEDGERVMEYGE